MMAVMILDVSAAVSILEIDDGCHNKNPYQAKLKQRNAKVDGFLLQTLLIMIT